MNAAQAFKELVIGNSSRGKGANALMNVTFFMGAGFSKTWDTKSPTGNELFTFPKEFIESLAAEIEIDELLTQPGYPTLDDTAPSKFKELLYNLSMQLKYPGIRTRYMDENSLNYVISEIKALVQQRFEAVTTLNHYAVDQNKFLLPPKLTNDQSDILRFFQWLSEQQRQDRGVAHGVHTDFLSTNYDYVLETILDNTGEGNALRNTYRGITPSLVCGKKNTNVVQDFWSINTLIKINGGFEIVPNGNNYDIDYRQRTFAAMRENAPEIMMPSKEQNYTSPYFSAIFPKAVRLLQESRVLVIVGYSLSEEDALLRFLVRQFAEDLRDASGKYIFYIDYTKPEILTERLQGCFRYMNRMDAGNIFTHSGGFVEWIKDVMAKA
jgi:hypothetical protein